MKKDNTTIIAAIGIIFMIGGVIWALGLAVREQPSYVHLAMAGILVIMGVFTLAFAMRDEKWAIV